MSERDLLTPKPALLALANGMVFTGISVGVPGESVGELVFNTAMTGYQEILTDPSYAKQLIVFTTPHVGNTGCNTDDMESSKVWAAGIIMNDCSYLDSNFRSEKSFPEWLKKQNLVAISGIDTRQLTLLLREQGAINACITTQMNEALAIERAKSFSGLTGLDLAKVVSRQTIERWHEGQGQFGNGCKPLQFHVVVYDFGVKQSILRILYDLGCHITLVPAQTTATEVLALNPDGILLSNGPGDPAACNYAIEATQQLLEHDIPLFGICLGFQILGLAYGARSTKMKFGHHGANHPVIEVNSTRRVFITSQNHGFSIEEASLPTMLQVTHRSLFDQSLQGFKHQHKPVLGFQGHPEASPGPHDLAGIFEEFIQFMEAYREGKNK